MIPTQFEYQRATSVDEAIKQLQAGGKIIAGGHSLVPLMKLRLSEPEVLIDIARIPGLSGIREAGGKIEIGAATVHHDIATSALLRDKCPALSGAAGDIGDPQVRNRGTIGGSLAHSDPSADYPAVMLALEADINPAPQGARTVKASAFFKDLFTVDRRARTDRQRHDSGGEGASGYAKLTSASHFAIIGVAAAEVKGGVIQPARLGLTGATAFATRD